MLITIFISNGEDNPKVQICKRQTRSNAKGYKDTISYILPRKTLGEEEVHTHESPYGIQE
jgi:hypothetical protein